VVITVAILAPGWPSPPRPPSWRTGCAGAAQRAPPRPAIERPAEKHLHFHGVDPAELAAIIADVNRDCG
jgi:hypothetical protein